MTNVIAIVPVANLAAANAVLEAMGRGSTNITKKLTTVPAPDSSAEATHYYMSDQNVDEATTATFLRFENGDLPPLPDGAVWGENGVIGAAAAMAAIAPANFAIAMFNDGYVPSEQLKSALAAHSVGLHIIPDPL